MIHLCFFRSLIITLGGKKRKRQTNVGRRKRKKEKQIEEKNATGGVGRGR